MEYRNCIICRHGEITELFQKQSKLGEVFRLVRCNTCGFEYLCPTPEPYDLEKYYGPEYFTTRTERGYDDYFSESTRREIERVMELNLKDLGFPRFEKSLTMGRRALDIGCAAGYFVEYLKERGWQASGIDVSRECVEFARERGLDVVQGDFLKQKYTEPFQAITLWATLEHLYDPDKTVEKIKSDLADDGMLYLSTCRTGGWNYKTKFGRNWRFYNFPEHMWFFSFPILKKWLEQKGFKVISYKTYGSGVGAPGGLQRRIADFLAKALFRGDMMIVAARKVSRG